MAQTSHYYYSSTSKMDVNEESIPNISHIPNTPQSVYRFYISFMWLEEINSRQTDKSGFFNRTKRSDQISEQFDYIPLSNAFSDLSLI